MGTWQDYFKDYTKTMNTGKQNALGALDKSQAAGMNQAAAQAGAAGLAGGGGRALGMVNDVALGFGQKKADTANQYDTQIAQAGMEAAQQQMAIDQENKKTEDAKPKWYDYVLSGVSAVGSALPGVGSVLGMLKKPKIA